MKERIFSFIAFDNHGEFLGFMQSKPKGSGMVTVWKDNLPKYIYTKDIGRTEIYNLNTIHRLSLDKQDKEKKELMEANKCK